MGTCTQVQTFYALDNWRPNTEIHVLLTGVDQKPALEGAIIIVISLP